jgi:hypothetical protein
MELCGKAHGINVSHISTTNTKCTCKKKNKCVTNNDCRRKLSSRKFVHKKNGFRSKSIRRNVANRIKFTRWRKLAHR